MRIEAKGGARDVKLGNLGQFKYASIYVIYTLFNFSTYDVTIYSH